jgi:outer membrane protein TolC
MRSPFLVAFAAALLGGCSSGPDFERPAKPAATGYTPESLAPQTSAAGGPGGAAQSFVPAMDIPGEWWTLFHSPQLDTLIKEALRANPDIDAAQAALRQARENFYAQQGSLFPTLTGNGQGTQQLASPASQGQTGAGRELIPAAGFITIIVPILVFLSLQRYFIRGMTSGAVKG